MSYSIIDISEVGPAEYPLIGVLRDSIFGEFGHHFSVPVEQQLEGRQDVLALIAHLEGNPVGFKVGFRDRPGHYRSWTGGVLPDYRGQGIARRMQHWQHGWIRSRGYRRVTFDTFNKFRPMMGLGLSTGFVPIGVTLRPENELSVLFGKDLALPDPAPREPLPRAAVHVESVGPNFHGLIADLARQTVGPTVEADVDRQLAGPDPLALVAFVESRPVGFTAGRGQDESREVFVSKMTGVLPEWQERGVGAALARHQSDAAAALGYRSLRRQAPHDNVALIRLALSAGFNLNGLRFDEKRHAALVQLDRPLNGVPRATPT